jgi:hypothetical protein
VLKILKEAARMTTSVAKKMGIKENSRAYFVNAPAEVLEAIDLPPLQRATELTGDFDYIHFFAKSQEEFNEIFPRLKAHLKPGGMLWVSWRKNRQHGTDLTLQVVIKLGYDYGLVESKTISIDKTWSAIKFTHPREDKIYRNRYGTLKS